MSEISERLEEPVSTQRSHEPPWRRLRFAVAVSPLTAIPVTALIIIVSRVFATEVSSHKADSMGDMVGSFVFMTCVALPSAYAAMLFVGLPLYGLAKRRDAFSYPHALKAAALVGLIGGILYEPTFQFWKAAALFTPYTLALAWTFAFLMHPNRQWNDSIEGTSDEEDEPADALDTPSDS